jgi:SNF2 family DNA or RNA helicase
MKRGVRFVIERGAAGLFYDPGLGKTSIILAAFKLLQQRGVVKRLLVIAPLRVAHSVWPVEAKKWDEFQHLRVVVLHGSKKVKLLRETADVYVINPEGLAWLERQRWAWPDMLVVDESTKFKHSRTERFKILRRLLPKFKRRVILSGTPAPNGLLDLFGQLYILDHGRALGRYITHYRTTYFYQSGYGGYTWVPMDGAAEKIYERIAPLVHRLDEADYLELPEKIVTDVRVDLPPKARRAYDRLKKEFLLQLEDDEVTAYNAAALTSKLRQVANGRVYVETELLNAVVKKSTGVHDEKYDALADLIDELQGQPLLIAYEFRHELEQLQKRFSAPVIGGGVAATEGKALIERWNAGQLPLLLVHPQSAGHGLNLQRGGNHIAWFGLTWDLEAYVQLIRRIWRQGQQRRVFVYRFIARGTIDEMMIHRLAGKYKTERALLDALRRMR